MRRLALATALAVALIVAPAAHAAFPGQNGKIAFVNDTGAGPAIFTVNPDGTGLSGPLTSGPNNDQDPAWSADGQKIAYTHWVTSDGSQTQVWVMNADGSGKVQLTTGNQDCDPAFLPDGRVVFVRLKVATFCDLDEGGEIWIRDLDGSEHRLTLPPSNFFDTNPTSSPNGATIAFSRVDLGFGDAVIYTVPSGGGTATPLTSDHEGSNILDSAPNYSPNGGTVAFQRCPAGETCTGSVNLFTIGSGGGTPAQQTFSQNVSDPDNCQPAYAPDGTSIVFAQFPGSSDCQRITPGSAPVPQVVGGLPSLSFIGPSGGTVQPSSVVGFLPDWQPLTALPAAGGNAGAAAKPDLGKCFGHDVTIAGTTGNDKIVGTPGDDVIHGYRGNDKINGKGGDDILCGGRGKDKILGKAQDDILIGGKGADYLNGGTGQNKLFGGTPGAPQQDFNNTCVNGPNDKLENCQTVK
jgi:Tol biopolymer transport system component